MSYVDKTIGKNETIIYRVQFHWTFTFLAFLNLLLLGVFIIGIYYFIKMMINKWTTERVLTNERYIQKIDGYQETLKKCLWIELKRLI